MLYIYFEKGRKILEQQLFLEMETDFYKFSYFSFKSKHTKIYFPISITMRPAYSIKFQLFGTFMLD